MKVILLENFKKLGSIGQVIEVKRGFARNFLIANKKALYASKDNISQVEKIKIELSKKDNEKKQQAKEIAERINKKQYNIKKLSTENNELYGSVKPTEISKLIHENEKIISFDFSFLDENKNYKLDLFSDSLNTHWKDNPMEYEISNEEIT